MGMLEVADLMKRYARFMIGSEEMMQVYGWEYEDFLNLFNQNTTPTPKDFCIEAVETSTTMTLGCFNLSNEKHTAVTTALNNLSEKILELWDIGVLNKNLIELDMFNKSMRYTSFDIDLHDFTKKTIWVSKNVLRDHDDVYKLKSLSYKLQESIADYIEAFHVQGTTWKLGSHGLGIGFKYKDSYENGVDASWNNIIPAWVELFRRIRK